MSNSIIDDTLNDLIESGWENIALKKLYSYQGEVYRRFTTIVGTVDFKVECAKCPVSRKECAHLVCDEGSKKFIVNEICPYFVEAHILKPFSRKEFIVYCTKQTNSINFITDETN